MALPSVTSLYLLILRSFNDAPSASQVTSIHRRVGWKDDNECWISVSKAEVVAYFKITSLRSLGDTEDNHENPQSG
jgi:hypothetical protein